MKSRYLSLFLFPFLLFADKAIDPTKEPKIEPWLTGPLLAPSGLVVPKGDYYFEPYNYLTAYTGKYDQNGDVVEAETSWNNSFQPYAQFGLTSWLDCDITLILNYNYTQHQAAWTFGDIPFAFDIQLYQPDPNDWMPNIKMSLKETFPTGKYDKLDPQKKGTDIGGGGSFVTGLELVLGKLIHLGGVRFMTTRLSFLYNIPSPIRIKDLSVYGGGKGTNARFFPAQNFQADLGLEVMLTQNVALAWDLVGTWAKKTHFTGEEGPAPLGRNAFSTQYSMAPAIEYNWSQDIGIIAGSWFTFAGKNSNRFWSAVIAFSYYIPN